MSFRDVAFLSSRACFSIEFLKNRRRCENHGTTPHVLKLWLGVSRGMLPVTSYTNLTASNTTHFSKKEDYPPILIAAMIMKTRLIIPFM